MTTLPGCGGKPTTECLVDGVWMSPEQAYHVLLSSDGSKECGAKPDWLDDGRDPRYPDASCLVGVGSAPVGWDPIGTIRRADDQARAEIGKAIRVRVQASYRVYQRETRHDGVAGGSSESDVSAKTESTVDLELEGVRIIERYRDGERVFALAVLDRSLAVKHLDVQMEDLSRQIDAVVRTTLKDVKAGEIEMAAFALNKAKRAFEQYANLNAERMLLAPTDRVLEKPPQPTVSLCDLDDAEGVVQMQGVATLKTLQEIKKALWAIQRWNEAKARGENPPYPVSTVIAR